jgi:hypothetical protein
VYLLLRKEDLLKNFSLDKLFDKMKDYNSGILRYQGVKSPSWDTNKFYTFIMDLRSENMVEGVNVIYFDIRTKDFYPLFFKLFTVIITILAKISYESHLAISVNPS